MLTEHAGTATLTLSIALGLGACTGSPGSPELTSTIIVETPDRRSGLTPPQTTTGALDRLNATGRFDLFVAAVEASARQADFEESNTVFAPTDAAFRVSLSDRDIVELFDDPDALDRLVARHIVPGVAIDGSRLADFAGRSVFVASDGARTEFVVTNAGELEYFVEADASGTVSGARAGARIDSFGVVDTGPEGVVVHQVESLVSIDHSLAIDHFILIEDSAVRAAFSNGCFGGQNSMDLPQAIGRLSYTFNPGGTAVVTNDVRLTERARITFEHVGGTPEDSGVALFDADLDLVAANDDSGSDLRTALESTVLEPGLYCLAYGAFEGGTSVVIPPEGWRSDVEVGAVATFGAN